MVETCSAWKGKVGGVPITMEMAPSLFEYPEGVDTFGEAFTIMVVRKYPGTVYVCEGFKARLVSELDDSSNVSMKTEDFVESIAGQSNDESAADFRKAFRRFRWTAEQNYRAANVEVSKDEARALSRAAREAMGKMMRDR